MTKTKTIFRGPIAKAMHQTVRGRHRLIGTCRLNDIAPQAWLADVLGRIAIHPAKKLDELLPWNWVNARAEAALEAA
jgi:transposase